MDQIKLTDSITQKRKQAKLAKMIEMIPHVPSRDKDEADNYEDIRCLVCISDTKEMSPGNSEWWRTRYV